MLEGDYTSVNHTAVDGFVSVGDADKLRQDRIVSEFKSRYADKFQRAVDAEVARAAADKEVELSRADMVTCCPQGSAGDLFRAVSLEANKVKMSLPRRAPSEPDRFSLGIEKAHLPHDLKVGNPADSIPDVKIAGQKLSKK